MHKRFFTVGPTQMYPTLPKHIAAALAQSVNMISHRSKEYSEIHAATVSSLRRLLSIPATHEVFFMGSATEAMERVVQNTVDKRSFHFVNGSFSKTFWLTAQGYNKLAAKQEVEPGQGFEAPTVSIPKNTELIAFTQNETSTGVMTPMDDIYRVGAKNPNSLIALDVVSAAPYLGVDFSKVDMVFFSVQKGFGLPAGLGVLIVNERAIQKAQQLKTAGAVIGHYHNFLQMLEFAKKSQTPETPNVMSIYLLGKVVEDMAKLGLKALRQETDDKAKLIYDFFDSHPKFKPAVAPRFRSPTVIVIDTPGETTNILPAVAKRGFVLGSGYSSAAADQIRIGNFPAHSIVDVKALLNEGFQGF